MTYKEITEIRTEWEKCTSCPLGEQRKKNNEDICIGSGLITPQMIIIIPKPRFQKDQVMVPYGDYYPKLKAIMEKSNVDIMSTYILPTIACKTVDAITQESILSCNIRIKQLIYLLDPYKVVLMGPESYFAFTGFIPSKKDMGKWVDNANRSVFYTYDLERFDLEKDQDLKKEMAADILTHWKLIGNTTD
jgi:uracil-DNA glycosylase